MIDLNKLNATGIATLHLAHPATGELLYSDKKPVTISGYGSDSNEYRKVHANVLRRIQKNKARRKNNGFRGQEDVEMTPEEVREAITETSAKVITSWTEIGKDGELLECCEVNAMWVIENVEWIREQWMVHLNDRAAFLPET